MNQLPSLARKTERSVLPSPSKSARDRTFVVAHVTAPATWIESTHQPVTLPLLSAPKRHLKTTFCPAAVAGRRTIVVIYPPESPVHAARPPSGLLAPV